MSKFYKEGKKVNESKFVAEHCEDLTFEMYISDIKASGCDVASMNELRDEFEAAGLQVTGENGPEGVIMKVTANDPEQCESVYNILMGHGCDESYVDFIMNNPAQHDGESFIEAEEDFEEDFEEEIPFESVNGKKLKNAILESIKKDGCGCAPKKLNESEDPYVGKYFLVLIPELEVLSGQKKFYTLKFLKFLQEDSNFEVVEYTIKDPKGILTSCAFLTQDRSIANKIASILNEKVRSIQLPQENLKIRPISFEKIKDSTFVWNSEIKDSDSTFESAKVNDKKLKNAILESIKKDGCGCAPKKLNESEESPYVGKYFWVWIPDEKKLEVAESLHNHPNLEFVECEKEYPDGIFKFYAILTQNHLIAEKIASKFNEKVLPIRLPAKNVNIRPISAEELANAKDGMINESSKPGRIKRLNESAEGPYVGEYFVWICSPEEGDMVQGFDILKSLKNHPNLEIVEGDCGDSSGYYKCYGVVTPNQLLANEIASRFNKEVYALQFPSDEEYDGYDLFIEFGKDYEEPGLGINVHPTSVEEIEVSAFESAKPDVKSPFGSVKVNGKKLGECGKGELRQMLREAKQELKELKKEEKSLGEGCGKRAKNKIAKKIEKAEKLVEILEEEIKFNPKKAGAVNEAKTLWKEFTKWSKLYEAESEEDEEDKKDEKLTSEKTEDSEEETEEKEDEVEEAELEAILLTVKNIEKVNQNLIDAGIPEEHIQMIPDEEDPKQGKIRVDAEDAIILKEYLATLGIDLEEEIGAELISDEEESEEKEDDSEEGEEKKDDDKEVNDDDVEVSAEDIFGDM